MPVIAEWTGFVIALVADVVALTWIVRGSESRKRLASTAAVAVLSLIVGYQGMQLSHYSATRNEARRLLDAWPSSDQLDFSSTGELIGTILDGLRFLERHRHEYPETYAAAQQLVRVGVGDFRPPTGLAEGIEESETLRDVAGAMIQLVRSTANGS